MLDRIVLSSALLLLVTPPALAGPCTQRIAELEKSMAANQAGPGSAPASPDTTGSTHPGTSSAAAPQLGRNVAAQNQGSSEAMQLLQQAKQLDEQGKEQECMQHVTRVSGMVPAQTK
jgi:hypothetical protein